MDNNNLSENINEPIVDNYVDGRCKFDMDIEGGISAKSFKKKKHHAFSSILIAILACLFVVGSGFGLYLVNRKDKMDVFKYATFVADGLDGEGEMVSMLTNEAFELASSKQQQLLNSIQFTYSKSDKLTNGDKITISIDKKQENLKKYKISPIELTKEFEVSGLAIMPTSWEDVKDKDKVINVADEFPNQMETIIRKRYDELSMKIPGDGIVSVSKDLIGTFYQHSDKPTCREIIDKDSSGGEYHCGSLALLYRLTITPPEGVELTGTDGTMYALGIATDIYERNSETECRNSFGEIYDSLNLTEDSESKIIDTLVSYGFVGV